MSGEMIDNIFRQLNEVKERQDRQDDRHESLKAELLESVERTVLRAVEEAVERKPH